MRSVAGVNCAFYDYSTISVLYLCFIDDRIAICSNESEVADD